MSADFVLTNHTQDLLIVTSLKVRYRDRTLMTGEEYFPTLRIPAGQSVTYSAPLLWNSAIKVADPSLSEYYQDRIVFREPGTHALNAILTVGRGRWIKTPETNHLDVEPLGDPIVVPFAIEVDAPQDKAGEAWWKLVESDFAFAAFLEQGVLSQAEPRYSEIREKLGRFVADHRQHPLGAEVRQKLERATKLRAKAPKP